MHVLAQKDGEVQIKASKSNRVAISGIDDMLPLRAHLQMLNLCFLWMTGHVETRGSNDDGSTRGKRESLARAKSHEETWPMREDDPINERAVLVCESLDASSRGLDGSNGSQTLTMGKRVKCYSLVHIMHGSSWSTRLFSQLTTASSLCQMQTRLLRKARVGEACIICTH